MGKGALSNVGPYCPKEGLGRVSFNAEDQILLGIALNTNGENYNTIFYSEIKPSRVQCDLCKFVFRNAT